MALVKCKECGKEISKDAEVCPNCGRKLNHSNLFLRIVGIIFILGIIGNIFGEDKNISNQTSNHINEEIITQPIEYKKVYPVNLQKQLEANAARAQQQYLGMYVEFEGRLRNIDANGKYFNVDSGGYISSIQCYIKNEEQKQILISKNIGNIVYVKGKISRVGEILGYSVDVTELK